MTVGEPSIMEASTMETMPLERLEAEITELAGQLAAGECRWLELIAEYDRRAGHETWGCRTIAHWLSWHCGLDVRSARERVRVAHALSDLPHVRDEFAAGRLSYSKVRAITRVATTATEGQLVMLAEHATAAQVERIVRSYRGRHTGDQATKAANEQYEHQFLRIDYDFDGTGILSARMPPEVCAALARALESARTHMSADQRGVGGPAGPPRSRDAIDVDALAMVAEAFMASEHVARDGGDRHLVSVNVDVDVLVGSDPDGTCEVDSDVDGEVALAPETVRRLCCDASTVAVIRRGGDEPLTVTRRTRTIPRSVRRTVRARDKGCRFPGCGERAFTDIHHVRHWARGGPSAPTNLLQLCSFHHRLVHEGGWDVRFLEDDEVVAITPAGNVLSGAVEPAVRASKCIEESNSAAGLAIDATTIVPRWSGDPLHLGDVVGGLQWLDERGDAA